MIHTKLNLNKFLIFLIILRKLNGINHYSQYLQYLCWKLLLLIIEMEEIHSNDRVTLLSYIKLVYSSFILKYK